MSGPPFMQNFYNTFYAIKVNIYFAFSTLYNIFTTQIQKYDVILKSQCILMI